MADTERVKTLEERATALRRHLLTMASNGQLIHLGGSASIAELMAALFFDFLDLEGKEGSKDHFILSKGHTVHAMHACLAELGKIDAIEFTSLAQMGTRLAGHPSLKAPLVEFATGSLGHGLAVGIGMALAGRVDDKGFRVYIVMGDGECQEGSVWEAAMTASHLGLDKLTAIVDRNHISLDGRTEEINALEPFTERWRAFGWHVIEVDGHDVAQLYDGIQQAHTIQGRPTVLVANTIKGKGVSFLEDTHKYHYAALSADQLAQARIELGRES